MAENEAPKSKQRPIVRVGIYLISHSFFFSIVCCSAGVLMLFILPILAKNTYISENALMPGSANPMLSNQEVSVANRFVKDLIALSTKPRSQSIESQRLIAEYMSDLGAEVNHHGFHPQTAQFHPLKFFSSPDSRIIEKNISCSSYGTNTIGIIRAPRGDGKEAIVLVTPYNSKKIKQGEALSLGIAYSVFSLLSQVTWLAKDIIWLASDSHHGEYTGVSSWLRDYHMPVFTEPHKVSADSCPENSYAYEAKDDLAEQRKIYDGFRRAGTMAAALVIKVGDKRERFEDSLSIYAEASNGQMPNLDLVNIVNYLAVHRQGFRVKVDKLWSLVDSTWLKNLGNLFESLGSLAKNLNPQWKFGIPAADYAQGVATLANSLYNQALGVPTGPHGAFRDYQVDAITLEISPRASFDVIIRQTDFLLRGGRLIEGVVRSVNNLLEKFHQSFFLYLLTSPSKFVSVGVYMIAFALLVAPLPVVAASLYADATSADSLKTKGNKSSLPNTASEDETILSWKWVTAAKKVFSVHLWGSVVSLLPYFICQIPNLSATMSISIWVVLSLLGFLIMNLILTSKTPRFDAKEWAILKSVTISSGFIGLCLMSVINFSTAEIGGLLVVPMCLMAHPMRLDIGVRTPRSLSRLVGNLVIILIGFPPVTFVILKSALEGFDAVNVGDFWIWVESLWTWSSATYLYISMVHLPCWALCLQVFFHRTSCQQDFYDRLDQEKEQKIKKST